MADESRYPMIFVHRILEQSRAYKSSALVAMIVGEIGSSKEQEETLRVKLEREQSPPPAEEPIGAEGPAGSGKATSEAPEKAVKKPSTASARVAEECILTEQSHSESVLASEAVGLPAQGKHEKRRLLRQRTQEHKIDEQTAAPNDVSEMQKRAQKSSKFYCPICGRMAAKSVAKVMDCCRSTFCAKCLKLWQTERGTRCPSVLCANRRLRNKKKWQAVERTREASLNIFGQYLQKTLSKLQKIRV